MALGSEPAAQTSTCRRESTHLCGGGGGSSHWRPCLNVPAGGSISWATQRQVDDLRYSGASSAQDLQTSVDLSAGSPIRSQIRRLHCAATSSAGCLSRDAHLLMTTVVSLSYASTSESGSKRSDDLQSVSQARLQVVGATVMTEERRQINKSPSELRA